MNVSTTKGSIDISDLVIKDQIILEDNTRIFTTEWYLNDELVRRDVNINILEGLSLAGETTQT